MSDPGHAAGGAALANTSKVIDARAARPPYLVSWCPARPRAVPSRPDDASRWTRDRSRTPHRSRPSPDHRCVDSVSLQSGPRLRGRRARTANGAPAPEWVAVDRSGPVVRLVPGRRRHRGGDSPVSMTTTLALGCRFDLSCYPVRVGVGSDNEHLVLITGTTPFAPAGTRCARRCTRRYRGRLVRPIGSRK
jgi:hypothetical protein